jgi:hypothetical protein
MVSFAHTFIHSFIHLIHSCMNLEEEEEKQSVPSPINQSTNQSNESLNSQETPNTAYPCSSSSHDRPRSRTMTAKEAGASSRMEERSRDGDRRCWW